MLKNLQNPIIFIGTGRSGTTIISEIIMRHPDLAFPNNYQDKFLKNNYINLIRLMFDNSLWRLFGQKKQLNKTSFFNRFYFKPSEAYLMWDYLTGEDVDFSRSFLLEESLTEERIDFIRHYFFKMIKFQNKKRLTFKITGPSRITFLLKIFPDAIFINLKRSTIPTISSFLNVSFWKTRGINQLWWTGAYTKQEQKRAFEISNKGYLITAFQLKKIHEITEIEKKSLKPNKYIEVYYENFVTNPEKELNRIINFVNLSPIDLNKYLKKIKIYNRNKKDTDYFNDNELNEINNILQIK